MRERKTSEEIEEIKRDWKRSGLSQAHYADKIGMKRGLLGYYMNREKYINSRREKLNGKKNAQKTQIRGRQFPPGFVQVGGGEPIELELKDGTRVRCPLEKVGGILRAISEASVSE